jgi:hypothetical protein
MPFSVQGSDILRVLDPASVTTRASYSFGQAPWTPGELMRVESEGAAGFAGFNYPGRLDTDQLETIAGNGAAAAAAAFTYTTRLTVPGTADITAAEDYLDAVLVVYPGDYYKSRGTGYLARRINGGAGSIPAANTLSATDPDIYWKRTGANEISVVFGREGATTDYRDIPAGWVMELVVPTAAPTLVELAAAGQQALPIFDYMAADTAIVNVSRIYS